MSSTWQYRKYIFVRRIAFTRTFFGSKPSMSDNKIAHIYTGAAAANKVLLLQCIDLNKKDRCHSLDAIPHTAVMGSYKVIEYLLSINRNEGDILPRLVVEKLDVQLLKKNQIECQDALTDLKDSYIYEMKPSSRYYTSRPLTKELLSDFLDQCKKKKIIFHKTDVAKTPKILLVLIEHGLYDTRRLSTSQLTSLSSVVRWDNENWRSFIFDS